MGILEAILALVGLAALVGAAVRWNMRRPLALEPAPEDDLAAPYREALYAALRMQVAAQELKQQMYAEAVRQSRTTQTGSRNARQP
jgi:hypothetical protein